MALYVGPEHNRLRDRVRAFALEHIAPIAREIDRTQTFPWENVRAMGEMGLLGLPIPEQYGGMGRDYLSYILVIEELARHDASHAITVSAHTTLGASPILNFGSEAQKRRYLPLLASGQVLGGFGLTEPAAGSDSAGTRTRAVREADGYRINGSKIFITHAGVGEVFTITALTNSARGTRGITSFIVTKPTTDMETARRLGVGHCPELAFTRGVSAGKKEDKMGWRASDTRELVLDNALVPAANRLGAEGEGFVNFMRTLDAGRIGIAALALGIAEGAFDAALEYTLERKRYGHRIYDYQAVQFRLSDMATEIQAAKHLTYHAAWLKDQEQPYSKEASMAKLFASELSMRATTEAIELMGGAGYTNEHPVERMFRDAKVCEIGEGTSEIQRLLIARHLVRGAGGGGRAAEQKAG